LQNLVQNNFFLGFLPLLFLLCFGVVFGYVLAVWFVFVLFEILDGLNKNPLKIASFFVFKVIPFMISIDSQIIYILIFLIVHILICLTCNLFENFMIYKDFRKFYFGFFRFIFFIFLNKKLMKHQKFDCFLFSLYQLYFKIYLNRKFQIEPV